MFLTEKHSPVNRISVACSVQIAQDSQTQKNIAILCEYEIIGIREHK